MSDRERLLEEVTAGPRNVRFALLVKLMRSWNFNDRIMSKGGHGVVFQHRQYIRIRVTSAHPHGSQKVRLCYVKDCLDAIDWVKQMEGENHG